jgi:hypothetical protein
LGGVLVLTIIIIVFFIIRHPLINVAPEPLDKVPTDINLVQSNTLPIPTGDYQVNVKANKDTTKNDIYLQDIKTQKELLFATVNNNGRSIESSWLGETYINGNVYLYSVNGDQGEIWVYSRKNLIGTKLYSDNRGLGFSISPDEKFIVVNPYFNNGDKTGQIVLLDGTGRELKRFEVNVEGKIVQTVGIEVYEWTKDSLWLEKGELTQVTGLIKIDLNNLTLKEYTFSGVHGEFSLNPSGTYAIESDYPHMFDVDSEKQFETAKTKVTLSLYNLSTGKSKIIATTGGNDFEYKWVDDVNYSYTDPETNKVVTGKAE